MNPIHAHLCYLKEVLCKKRKLFKLYEFSFKLTQVRYKLL